MGIVLQDVTKCYVELEEISSRLCKALNRTVYRVPALRRLDSSAPKDAEKGRVPFVPVLGKPGGLRERQT